MVPRSVQRGPTAPMREAVARANDVHRMQTGAGQSAVPARAKPTNNLAGLGRAQALLP